MIVLQSDQLEYLVLKNVVSNVSLLIPNIVHLNLSHVHIEEKEFDLLNESCRKLEVLSLINCQ